MKSPDWKLAPPNALRVENGDGTVSYIDNSRAVFEWHLLAQGVSPAIVERVMRLNASFPQGQIPRGIHYKSERAEMHLYRGAIGKGEFIRRHGRAAFEAIRPDHLIKRGRRVYVSYRWRDHVHG